MHVQARAGDEHVLTPRRPRFVRWRETRGRHRTRRARISYGAKANSPAGVIYRQIGSQARAPGDRTRRLRGTNLWAGADDEHHARGDHRVLAGALSRGQHDRDHVEPAAKLATGVSFLIAAFVFGTARHQASTGRARKRDKGPPRRQQALGTARLGPPSSSGLLTPPGASYPAGLNPIDDLNYSVAQAVVLILAFNLVMLALLETSLLSFMIGPGLTLGGDRPSEGGASRHGHRFAFDRVRRARRTARAQEL